MPSLYPAPPPFLTLQFLPVGGEKVGQLVLVDFFFYRTPNVRENPVAIGWIGEEGTTRTLRETAAEATLLTEQLESWSREVK